MKRNNSEFLQFQKEFKKWQTRFGLNGYQVYFYHEDLGDNFADINVIQNKRVATVRLDTKKHADCNIKKSAKHEALHLLCAKLQDCALKRYTSEEEILEADEELVVRLQGLIE